MNYSCLKFSDKRAKLYQGRNLNALHKVKSMNSVTVEAWFGLLPSSTRMLIDSSCESNVEFIFLFGDHFELVSFKFVNLGI